MGLALLEATNYVLIDQSNVADKKQVIIFGSSREEHFSSLLTQPGYIGYFHVGTSETL